MAIDCALLALNGCICCFVPHQDSIRTCLASYDGQCLIHGSEHAGRLGLATPVLLTTLSWDVALTLWFKYVPCREGAATCGMFRSHNKARLWTSQSVGVVGVVLWPTEVGPILSFIGFEISCHDSQYWPGLRFPDGYPAAPYSCMVFHAHISFKDKCYQATLQGSGELPFYFSCFLITSKV